MPASGPPAARPGRVLGSEFLWWLRVPAGSSRKWGRKFLEQPGTQVRAGADWALSRTEPRSLAGCQAGRRVVGSPDLRLAVLGIDAADVGPAAVILHLFADGAGVEGISDDARAQRVAGVFADAPGNAGSTIDGVRGAVTGERLEVEQGSVERDEDRFVMCWRAAQEPGQGAPPLEQAGGGAQQRVAGRRRCSPRARAGRPCWSGRATRLPARPCEHPPRSWRRVRSRETPPSRA